MVKYDCQRCGFKTHLRSNFNKHLNRKNPCIAKLNNVSIKEIKIKYGLLKSKCKVNESKCKVNVFEKTGICKVNVLEKTGICKVNVLEKTGICKVNVFECKFCHKQFSTKQGKYQHQTK